MAKRRGTKAKLHDDSGTIRWNIDGPYEGKNYLLRYIYNEILGYGKRGKLIVIDKPPKAPATLSIPETGSIGCGGKLDFYWFDIEFDLMEWFFMWCLVVSILYLSFSIYWWTKGIVIGITTMTKWLINHYIITQNFIYNFLFVNKTPILKRLRIPLAYIHERTLDPWLSNKEFRRPLYFRKLVILIFIIIIGVFGYGMQEYVAFWHMPEVVPKEWPHYQVQEQIGPHWSWIRREQNENWMWREETLQAWIFTIIAMCVIVIISAFSTWFHQRFVDMLTITFLSFFLFYGDCEWYYYLLHIPMADDLIPYFLAQYALWVWNEQWADMEQEEQDLEVLEDLDISTTVFAPREINSEDNNPWTLNTDDLRSIHFTPRWSWDSNMRWTFKDYEGIIYDWKPRAVIFKSNKKIRLILVDETMGVYYESLDVLSEYEILQFISSLVTKAEWYNEFTEPDPNIDYYNVTDNVVQEDEEFGVNFNEEKANTKKAQARHIIAMYPHKLEAVEQFKYLFNKGNLIKKEDLYRSKLANEKRLTEELLFGGDQVSNILKKNWIVHPIDGYYHRLVYMHDNLWTVEQDDEDPNDIWPLERLPQLEGIYYKQIVDSKSELFQYRFKHHNHRCRGDFSAYNPYFKLVDTTKYYKNPKSITITTATLWDDMSYVLKPQAKIIGRKFWLRNPIKFIYDKGRWVVWYFCRFRSSVKNHFRIIRHPLNELRWFKLGYRHRLGEKKILKYNLKKHGSIYNRFFKDRVSSK